MSRSEIIGSWHNSGFYGHLRSKPRNDFVIEYRHQAKPTPPRIFTKRAQLPSSSHVFSKHDNRHSFLNDALYFEEGLGRKRLENETNRYDANLLSWMSNGRPEPTSAPLSSYMVDYRGVMVDANKLNQRIIRRVKTGSVDVDRLPTTAYRYTHSVDNPYLGDVLQPSKDSVTINRIQKPSSNFSRESVASCLSWHVAPGPSAPPSPAPQSWLPAATKSEAYHDQSAIEVPVHLPVIDDSAKVEKLPTMTTSSTSPLQGFEFPSRIMAL